MAYSVISGAPTAPANTPAVSNEYITAYNSTTGAFTQAQPAYSQLSGLPTIEYQTVEGAGTALTQRATLNLIGSVSCVDNSGLARTDCTFSGGSGSFYQTVDANGTAQVQQPIVNFISGANASVTCTNNGGATRTDCTFAASSSAGGRLDQISPAGATNTDNNTTFAQVWNWALAGSTTAFTFGEATAATGSGNIILRATTALSSTAVPFQADSNGNGVLVSASGKLTKVGTGSIDAPSLSGLVPAASLPNPSASTLGGVESAAAVSHQWINSISASGVPALSQPAFTDISGSVAASQLPNPGASTLGGVESISCTNQFLNQISTSGVPQCATVAYSQVSGTPTLPANTPAVASQILTAYNSSTGAFTQAALPNPSATALGGIESLAFTSHFFVSSISTSGVPSATQPAFTDISGSVAASQLPNPSASTLGGIESYNAVSHQWINAISTSGVPSSTQPQFTDIAGTATEAQLTATTVFTDQAATFGAHAYDFSAATNFVIPKAAGATPTASGNIAYDTTANDYEGGVNGTNHIFAFIDSNLTGNAATATALVAAPSQCTGVNIAYGIAASGNANCNPLPNPAASTLGGVESLSCSATTWLNAISTSGVPNCAAVTWDLIGGAAANATIANAGHSTTFTQTNAANWFWENITAATSTVAQNSPILNLAGTYWNGTASALDGWTIQDVIAGGRKGGSLLTFAHSGTSAAVPATGVSIPSLVLGLGENFTETTAPATAATFDTCYGDSTLHGIKCEYNNSGTYSPLLLATGALTNGHLLKIASGTTMSDAGLVAANVMSSGCALPCGSGAGAVNVMTVTTSPVVSALGVGTIISVLPNLANTTTNPTLNADGTGNVVVEKLGSGGSLIPLAPGDWGTASLSYFMYDGANYELLNPLTDQAGTNIYFDASGNLQCNSAGGCNIGTTNPVGVAAINTVESPLVEGQSITGQLLLHGSFDSSTASATLTGNTILRCGNDTATTGTATACSTAVGPGSVSSASGTQGIYWQFENYFAGATVTQYNLECESASMTVVDCGATSKTVIGVANTTATPVQVVTAGQMFVNATSAVTLGDTVCTGATAGKITD